MNTPAYKEKWEQGFEPETEEPIPEVASLYGSYQDPISLQPAIRRWWWWFILAGIVSAPLAFFVANEVATDSYIYDTSLIFNRSHYGAPLYEPPDIYALAALSASPALLSEMKHELRLEPGVDRLQELLEPEVRAGSNVMRMSLEWDDPKKARQVLDWLNERLIQRVKKLRDKRIDNALVDLKDRLMNYESQTQNYHNGIVNFRTDNNTYSVPDQLRATDSDQAMLEKELAVAVAEMEAISEQMEGFKTLMKEAEAAEEEINEEALDDVDLEVQSATEKMEKARKDRIAQMLDQIEQTKLQQQIREEKERARLTTQRDAKLRELDDARKLYAQRLIPKSEVTVLEDDLRLIELDLNGTRRQRDWEKELDELKTRLNQGMIRAVENGELSISNLSIGGPTAETPAKTYSELTEKLKLQFNARKNLVDQLHTQIERTLDQKAKLQTLLPESERLRREFMRAEQSRARLDGQVSDLEMLKRSDSNLLTVLDGPAPGAIPMKSNMKKLLVGIYCVSVCVLCMPIVLRELFAPTPGPNQHRQYRPRPR